MNFRVKMEHLFKAWSRIQKKINKNNLFLFLDFDGTLTPIVSTPEAALLSEKVRKLLRKIAGRPKVRLAFISGRRLGDIKNKIGIKNAIYAGSHGLQLEGPKIKFKLKVSAGYRMTLERIKADLRGKIAHIQGAFLEDKGLVLSLHYRLASKKKIPDLKKIFRKTVISHLLRNKIRITEGEMVFEVRPPVKWDKGRAVLWLLKRSPLPPKGENTLPIYIGDDMTDEDAFGALRNKGLTVFVGKPKKSRAEYYLKNNIEVQAFLERILKRRNGGINKSKRAV